MFEYIYLIYSYTTLFITFGFFAYLYRYFYNNCNQLVKIKTKHGKTKSVIKPKIILSILYFVLIIIIYNNLTYKIFMFFLSIIMLGTLNGFEQFYFGSSHFIYRFDNNKIIRIIWKLFSTIITFSFLIYNPFFKTLDNYINNKKNLLQSLFNKNLLFSDKSDNNKPKEKNIETINRSKSNKKVESSEIFDYVLKSSKKTDKSSELKNKKENKILLQVSEKVLSEDSSFKDSSFKESTNKMINKSSYSLSVEPSNDDYVITNNKDNIIENFKNVNKLLNSNNINDIEDITITENNK